MKTVVLDAGTFGDDLDLTPLSEFGELEIFRSTRPEETAKRLRGADIAVINKHRMNASTLCGVTSLKLICVFATGYDNIDLAYCAGRGIAVCNAVGYSTASVTQFTLAAALSLVSHLPQYSGYVAGGSYSSGGAANRLEPVYHEIAGRQWGVAGFGNIGSSVARAAEALGCRVAAYSRHEKPGAVFMSLDELCASSDIISLHLPLSDATRGIIDRRRIAMMKPDCILINAARGAVTDEAAVADAVLDGRIAGFGCDVYSTEPFGADHPFSRLLGLPNVCLTPHMAWGSYEARVRCLGEVVSNIRSFLSGGKKCRVDLL
ncbi:MAG: hydroxyacid dehydrogenase [Clostridia bacterium]|nr:hydroxyacid dehydrogenase [Clostridia bacterium]